MADSREGVCGIGLLGGLLASPDGLGGVGGGGFFLCDEVFQDEALGSG